MPTVTSVSPANGATRVPNDNPVQVELTRADSTDYTKVETTQADFAAGTLVNVGARVTNDLSLLFNNDYVDNFDSDTIGQLPSGWDVQYGTGFTVQTGLTGKAVKHVGTSPTRNAIRWTAHGQIADVDIKAQWKVDNINSDIAIIARLSGGSGTENGYLLQAQGDGATFYVVKYVNGTGTQVGGSISFTYVAGTVYWMRLQVIGTAIKARLWADGSNEPGTWNLSTSDASLTTGYVGLNSYSPVGSWWDFFTIIGGNPSGVYPTSGSRVSPAYALSTVGKFSTGIVQYDVTLPANTTLTVKISKDGATWTTVASGDRIALWSDGDNLAAANIYTEALLTTSDTSVTPVLSEVRLIFMAIDSSLVEITVDGLSFKVSSANLGVWHTAKVTAGPVIVDPCTQDLFFATLGPWYAYGCRSYTVLVKYSGTTISTTTFTNELCETYRAWLPFSFMAVVGNGVYDGPMSAWVKFFVGALEDIWLTRGEVHYLVAEIPRGAMDGRYFVAHAFAADMPASGIVGQPVPTDVPLSAVIYGWLLGDTPASGILQGWMRADSPLSGIVAALISHDEVASGIVGLPIETAGVLSGVIYEVNDRNAIELRVISVEEAGALAALGIVIQ